MTAFLAHPDVVLFLKFLRIRKKYISNNIWPGRPELIEKLYNRPDPRPLLALDLRLPYVIGATPSDISAPVQIPLGGASC